MNGNIKGALVLATAVLAGCTTTGASGPVQATRFHLGAATIARGTVAIEPLPGAGPASLEFKTYADAVESQLLAAGYGASPANAPAEFLAVVGFSRTERAGPPKQSPISIGLGGGSFGGGRGGGVGLGGGVSFPVGKRGSRELIVSELTVQIRRRSDGAAMWEGRAQTTSDVRAPDAAANVAAGKLAEALFRGFPGESGRTITVK